MPRSSLQSSATSSHLSLGSSISSAAQSSATAIDDGHLEFVKKVMRQETAAVTRRSKKPHASSSLGAPLIGQSGMFFFLRFYVNLQKATDLGVSSPSPSVINIDDTQESDDNNNQAPETDEQELSRSSGIMWHA